MGTFIKWLDDDTKDSGSFPLAALPASALPWAGSAQYAQVTFAVSASHQTKARQETKRELLFVSLLKSKKKFLDSH